MTKEEIQQLAEKIVSGTATDEEIMLYNRICSFAEASVNDVTEIAPTEKAALEASLKKAILGKTGKTRVYRMRWFRWTVVAAMFVLVAGAGYMYLFSVRSSQPDLVLQNQTQLFTNDILPGRQGAVLTLANGQKIILDSAANGALATEGGARVIKKENKIVYNINKVPDESAVNTITTPPGRQYQLTLADGTAVWLNAGSSITYPTVFTGKQRIVKVTGEVYFEVSPAFSPGGGGKKIPFIVDILPPIPTGRDAGGGRVEVLGTHFNINAYGDEEQIRTTLLEGSVKVSSIVNRESAILKPGEQVSIRRPEPVEGSHASQLSRPIRVQTDIVMAWKNGRFFFSGTEISQLMRQLARWYDVEVEYNTEIKDLFYAEIPRNSKLSDVLRALELTGKVHFTIAGKKVIVMP